jgi:hypothetical protein
MPKQTRSAFRTISELRSFDGHPARQGIFEYRQEALLAIRVGRSEEVNPNATA